MVLNTTCLTSQVCGVSTWLLPTSHSRSVRPVRPLLPVRGDGEHPHGGGRGLVHIVEQQGQLLVGLISVVEI